MKYDLHLCLFFFQKGSGCSINCFLSSDYFKIPELVSAINSQRDTITEMSSSIICCPSPQQGSCLGKVNATHPGRICVDSDKDYENLKLSTLQMALDGWKNAIKSNEDAKKAAKNQKKKISHWFQGNGGNNEDLKITDIETPLVPEKLISSATMLDGTSQLLNGQEGAGSDNNRDSIRKTMRVQISGDAGMLEMSMSKASTVAYTKQNCNRIVPGILSGVLGALGKSVLGFNHKFTIPFRKCTYLSYLQRWCRSCWFSSFWRWCWYVQYKYFLHYLLILINPQHILL